MTIMQQKKSSDDLPSITRWNFEDFELQYDVKFGRKRNDCSDGALGNPDLPLPVQANEEPRGRSGVADNSSEKVPNNLLPAFESVEMQALAESISRDILHGNPNVRWDSIKGLENAKRLLKEAVVMPIKYPKCVETESYQSPT